MTVKTKTRAGRGHGFAQPLEWSAYKHKLLKGYLHVWCYKLGSATHELAFVDTCAGAGSYDDGSDGSPLIAARYNDDPGLRGRVGITVYAFETEDDVFSKLCASLAPYASRTPPRAIVSNESFFDAPQSILALTRKIPTLFFIDPFGTREVTWDHLSPVLTDVPRASTELLVRVDPTLLARYAGWVRRQSQSKEPVRGAAGFLRLLKRLKVDTEQIVEDAANDWDIDKYELFEQHLQLYTARFQYVQAVPIRASYWAAAKYMIIHATDSAHGAAHLNDVVSTLEDKLYAETEERKQAETGQGSLFAVERGPRYSERQLDEATYEFIEASGDTEFIELRADLANAFGPDFREKHHKAAVKRLMAKGRVEIASGDTSLKANTILRIKPRR